MNKPLEWECEKGHRWRANPNGIREGKWCLICAGKAKKTIHEMREIAKERGGHCLSEDYKNSQRPLLWECAKGHKWKARYVNISQGQWCPHCAGLTKKTVADMAVLAAEKGGQFLSDQYRGNGTKHEWKCSEGHTWLTTPNSVQRGQWCPECSKLLSERLTRVHFESIFDARFPTRKPEWLTNSRGNRMELDGYNEKLHLAFEYHGIQHYHFNPQFHRDEKALSRRISDDRLKRELCEAHGVSLIEIPYSVQPAQMKDFIIHECEQADIAIPEKARDISVSFGTAYLRGSKEKMDRLAEKFDGKCLSRNYVNAHTPLLWECKRGHQWVTKPNTVQQGHWCKRCNALERQTAQKQIMDILAKKRGGKCLSTAYVNSYTKLEWECQEGHKWWVVPSEIKRGTWCPECRRKM